jgi:very-short-patch-repair endonuclease
VDSAERENRAQESISELVARQQGVITVQQAAEFGISSQAIARRVASGVWARVMPRVYRVTAVPETFRQSCLAAVLWAGDHALISHATAAVLWGFESVRTRRVEIWIPRKQNLRSDAVVIHRGTRLDRADRDLLDGIRITTPTRTLIDMSGRLEDDRLLAVMEDLIRRNIVTTDRLEARLRALRKSGRPGSGRLEALLASRGSGRAMESALETLVWTMIERAQVPRPVRQHWVVLGGQRYRLDFAWPEQRVGLECDGREFHDGRAKWVNDRARLAEFGAVGWRVLPVTWHAASREPERVTRWLRTALFLVA